MISNSVVSSDKQRFSRRLKEARIGDPQAQYDVALMFANGAGVARNQVHAFSWTKAAAEKGHIVAQYLLGCAYAAGLGVDRSEVLAMRWFAKSSEAGHAKAAYRLARLLQSSSTELAFELAKSAASAGVADAMCFMAECLATGQGAEPDEARAYDTYMEAAEAGNAQAQFIVGRLLRGQSESSRDWTVARMWLRKAALQGHPGARLALNAMDGDSGGRDINQSPRVRATGRERRTSEGRWVKYAQHGHAQDAYDLGEMYQLGVGLERNPKQARNWFRRSAVAGLASGQFALAEQLASTEPADAVYWFELAAKQGHSEAQLALGRLYLSGADVKRDAATAMMWLSRSAHQGNADALFELAQQIPRTDDSLHRPLIERAAASGHAKAQFEMGEIYAHGLGLAKNWHEACIWYQKAADQDHGLAQCMLAGCYSRGIGVNQSDSMAFAWYERAAAQNIPQAQWNLGEFYAKGLSGIAQDARKAATLCKRAANAGFAPAQATLGALFAKAGKHERAVHWWKLAADQGDLESIYNLGQAYRLGKGIGSDFEQAFALFLRAANAGLSVAQARVGLAYATGDGVALDVVEACKWFELASDKGDASAKANLEKARSLLSPAQHKEVQRRVGAWRPERTET